jgi:hypothetical protein
MSSITKRTALIVAYLIFVVLAIGVVVFAVTPIALPQDDADSATGIAKAETKDAMVSSDDASAVEPDGETSGGVGNDGTAEGAAVGDGGGSASTGSTGSGSPSGPAAPPATTPGNSPGSGSPPPSEQPASPPSPPAPPPSPTCTISIDASAMGWGTLMSSRTVDFSEGESVLAVLQRECRNAGISLDVSGSYVRGIGGLYEFDGGSKSGWVYAVNGSFPSYGSNSYLVGNGDSIQWRYTLDRGNDVGGGSVAG